MLEEMKQHEVVIEVVEGLYRKKISEMLNKIWGQLLQDEDFTLNQEEFNNLVDELVEKNYSALELTFDTVSEVVDYCTHQLKYIEQNDMVQALTEKSTQDLMTEETMQKVFNL